MAYDDMLQAAVNSANPEPGIQQGIGAAAQGLQRYADNPANQQASPVQKVAALVQSGQVDAKHGATMLKLINAGHLPPEAIHSLGGAPGSGDLATFAATPMSVADTESLMKVKPTLGIEDRVRMLETQGGTRVQVANIGAGARTTAATTAANAKEEVAGTTEAGKTARTTQTNQTRKDVGNAKNTSDERRAAHHDQTLLQIQDSRAAHQTAMDSMKQKLATDKTIQEKRKTYEDGLRARASTQNTIANIKTSPLYGTNKDLQDGVKALEAQVAGEEANLKAAHDAAFGQAGIPVKGQSLYAPPATPAPAPVAAPPPGTDTTNVGGRVGAATDNATAGTGMPQMFKVTKGPNVGKTKVVYPDGRVAYQ